MADPIANRLLAALVPIQTPASVALSDNSSASSHSASADADGASSSETAKADNTASLPGKKNIENLEKWNDDLESQLLSGIQPFTEEDPTVTSETLKEAADTLHASILNEIAPSFVAKWEDDGAANKATLAAVESLISNTDFNHESVDLYQLASLLRAAGLFMRWNSQVLQSPYTPVNSPAEVAQNHMARLKFKSMLLLYAKLLVVEMPSLTPLSTESYPDVPRFASICLFRATYGDDVMTTTARRLFVNSMDGCSYLMEALLKGDQPVPRLFSVVRNVHHLIAACGPEAIPKMQQALETLATTSEQNENGETKHGLSEALVATLAWAFRSEPPFPGAKKDRRPDLVLEILRSLYALDTNKSHRPSKDTMTQIGFILVELLHLSNADKRVYEIKLSVVALLLNAPPDYTDYLVETDSMKQLVHILSYQTSLVVIEKTGSSRKDAAAILPILLALLKHTQTNKSAMQTVKDEVFPPEAEQAFLQKAQFEVSKGKTEGKVNAKNMAPLDAPRGTLRWKLIRLMTWNLESNVKRAACELLWVLCGEDSTQFVLRTGFGNAVHFLGIRGCVDLPAGVDI